MNARNAGDTKETIVGLLSEISSHDEEGKKAAEEMIEALISQDEFVGIHLTEIVLDPSGEPAIRLLASKHLKKYTETQSCKCSGPSDNEAQLKIKKQIMELLIDGLKETIDEIRKTVAFVLATNAISDWPRNWNNISEALLDSLNEENELVTGGAMQALRKCICHLGCALLDVAGEIILQRTYRVFENENYSVGVRSESVELFLSIVRMSKTGFIQHSLRPMIPIFCRKFVHYLSADNNSGQNYVLIASIIKTVDTLTEMLPKCISDFFPQLLSLIWKTLVDSAKVYHEICLTGIEGETIIYFERSVRDIIFFIDTLMNMSCAEGNEYSLSTHHCYYLQDTLSSEVFHHYITFLQITDDKIEQWTNDSSKFYTDEEQLHFPDCIRSEINMHLNVQNAVTDYKIPCDDTLVIVILKHLETESSMRLNHNSAEVRQNGWKLHEAFLFAFGIARDLIIERHNEGSLQFDIAAFLENVVIADLNDSKSHPLLIARCLCVGALYAEQMHPELASRFFKHTIKGMHNECFCVKICSLIAFKRWLCLTAVKSNYEHKKTLVPHLPALFQELFSIGSRSSSLDIIELVMRNVYLLALFHRRFTTNVESQIYTLVVTAYSHLGADSHMDRVIKYYIKQFTLNPIFRAPIQEDLIPSLTDKTFDVLSILVEHSPQPLSSLLIENAFPVACGCILNSCCSKTLEDGGKVICTYLSKAAQQVNSYKNEHDKTGRQYVSEVVAHLLNPNFIDSVALVACEILISTLNTPIADLQEKKELLSAVLRRMQTRRSEQSLNPRFLLIWAHLIKTRIDAAFELFFDIPSCVEFVSNELCRNYMCFSHEDRKNIVTPALCKIIAHGLTHRESQLHHIMFEETEERESENTPVLIKIWELITHELSV